MPLPKPQPQLVALHFDGADSFAPFAQAPVWVIGGNIQCSTFGMTVSARSGSSGSTGAQTMATGDVMSVSFCNLMDFLAKNTTPGSNGDLDFFGVIVASRDEMIAAMVGAA